MFTLNLNYIQRKYNSGYHTPFNFIQLCFGYICVNANKLGSVTSQSEQNGALSRRCHYYYPLCLIFSREERQGKLPRLEKGKSAV